MRMAASEGMWLEAILTREDLLDAFCKLSPLEIRFGESGVLNLSAPTAVAMNPGKSVAIVCDAALHVPVLGVNVPVHMHGLTVELVVSVHDAPGAEGQEAERGHGQVLQLGLRIDRTGVTHLPHFLDEGVTKIVNAELAKNHVAFAWNFHDTLTHSFVAPAALTTIAKLGLRVTGGRVRVTEDALGFAVGFDSEVEKRSATA
ncbi:MAG TPA: hypothetical protein VK841_22000 [Polyangiaceae bacterium]|nr:hypothetical protein [Polyangiaceae bacterium]